MKISMTLSFLALFLAVLAFYFWLGPSKKTAPIPPPSKTDKALMEDQSWDQMEWIQIQNRERKQTITLIRDEKKWRLKYPVSYPANQEMVQALIELLKNAKKERNLVPEKDWAEYGLLTPSIKIGFEISGISKRKYLSLGDVSPVRNMVFARWEGDKNYFLLDASFKQFFNQTADNLADKQIFDLPFSKLTRLKLHWGIRTYEFMKENGKWFWVKPEKMKNQMMEPSMASRLLEQVKQLSVKELPEPDFWKKQKDLSKITTNYVKIWQDEKISETLWMGAEIPGRNSFYARKEGEVTPFLIDRTYLKGVFDSLDILASNSDSLQSRAFHGSTFSPQNL